MCVIMISTYFTVFLFTPNPVRVTKYIDVMMQTPPENKTHTQIVGNYTANIIKDCVKWASRVLAQIYTQTVEARFPNLNPLAVRFPYIQCLYIYLVLFRGVVWTIILYILGKWYSRPNKAQEIGATARALARLVDGRQGRRTTTDDDGAEQRVYVCVGSTFV